jgi:hypothetical protein
MALATGEFLQDDWKTPAANKQLISSAGTR